MELAHEFVRGAVRETEVSGEELLIEDGRAKEKANLLFFDGISRQCQCMAAARENGAIDPSIERGEECERALFERENGITAAKLDAIGGNDVVGRGRVDAQRIDGIIQFVRCLPACRKNRRRQKTPQRAILRPCPHIPSVVTFGMGEQGGRGQAPDKN